MFEEGHTQCPQKIDLCSGILEDAIIGPVFKSGSIEPRIVRELDLRVNLLYFQQEGAPPHNIISVRQWLDNHYPNHSIGRRPLEWPPRSPDLSPLDFFLWGHLKSVVFKKQPECIEQFQETIMQECHAISRRTFGKIRQELEERLYHCLQNNGNNFEHLLNREKCNNRYTFLDFL